MSMLSPIELPKRIERVVITKLDNGYAVECDTTKAGVVGHYCSNIRGVTKTLWAVFEGKVRTTQDQTEFIKSERFFPQVKQEKEETEPTKD